jgi:GNAT superfamily N-acetyltransferase
MSVKSSLYAQYIKERSYDHILEHKEGFATYRYLDNKTTVYIVDIFVVQEARKSKVATRLADEIVKEASSKGCRELLGSVCPSSKGATTSLQVLIGYGMTLKSASNDFIIFTKEIK